jgi:hypothetical protein
MNIIAVGTFKSPRVPSSRAIVRQRRTINRVIFESHAQNNIPLLVSENHVGMVFLKDWREVVVEEEQVR